MAVADVVRRLTCISLPTYKTRLLRVWWHYRMMAVYAAALLMPICCFPGIICCIETFSLAAIDAHHRMAHWFYVAV